MPADVVPRGHEELLHLLREASGESRTAASPLPGYSRPTSASSAGGRLTPPRGTPATTAVSPRRALYSWYAQCPLPISHLCSQLVDVMERRVWLEHYER